MTAAPIRPLLPGTTAAQANQILGAMRAVAETGVAFTDADRTALQSTNRFMFGHDASLVVEQLPTTTPAQLAATLSGTAFVEDTAKFLIVMALIDGVLDKQKIAKALDYANALGVHAHYLDQMAEAAHDHIQAVLADMTRCNMESITNAPWAGGDVNAWLLPYAAKGKADPALAERYERFEAAGYRNLRPRLLDPFPSQQLYIPRRSIGAERALLRAARFGARADRLRHIGAGRNSHLHVYRIDASQPSDGGTRSARDPELASEDRHQRRGARRTGCIGPEGVLARLGSGRGGNHRYVRAGVGFLASGWPSRCRALRRNGRSRRRVSKAEQHEASLRIARQPAANRRQSRGAVASR